MMITLDLMLAGKKKPDEAKKSATPDQEQIASVRTGSLLSSIFNLRTNPAFATNQVDAKPTSSIKPK